ncbi:MAG: hypothetical protein JSS21_02705 [Proteobacteria bacterium]|nr:hypothetical protein [Pseudomonadota bacterium]
MNTEKRYSPAGRTRAVQMVLDHQAEYGSQLAAIASIATKFGCTLRRCGDGCGRPSVTGARPPVQAMKAFIEENKGTYGVEPICKAQPIAPSTYYNTRCGSGIRPRRRRGATRCRAE